MRKAVSLIIVVIAIPLLGFLMTSSTLLLAEEDSIHWSYGGADNPTQWGSLADDFAKCDVGRDQSPIDIDDAVDGAQAAIEFKYASVPLDIVNNGHTVEVNYQPGSTVSINGKEYELLQFHFHTPSEHLVSRRASAMELHLVHRNELGELAVVSVMIEEGAEHPIINKIWEQIPEEEKSNTVKGLTINAANLLPSSKTYFSYTGSLTTPPCSEDVLWNVLAEPIQVSEAQIAAFESLYPVNARPIQATNKRIIELHKE